MEQLETMKKQLTSLVEGQMSNIYGADCNELGQAIDMIKDLSEAIYYCTVTEAMKKQPEEQQHYYTEPYYRYTRPYEDWERNYYTETGGGKNYYNERDIETNKKYMGRSPDTRRMYMESKEMHHDKTIKMQELDKYMKELTSELVEMIEDSSPEEKQLLQQKLTTLTNKIAQVNV